MSLEQKNISGEYVAKYNTEYKDYSKHIAIMVSTDRLLFIEKSQVLTRMREYAKLYKELHVIVFSSKNIEPIQIADNCRIYSTNSWARWNFVGDACSIGKKIIRKSEKNDLVLVTCQDPFETALAGKCIANLRKDAELMLQIHTDLFNPYFTDSRVGIWNSILNRIRVFISRFTLTHAQVIRVVSNKIADSLVQRGIPSDKIIIRPIDVDVEYIRTSPVAFDLHQKYPQFKKIILMASRIEVEKNIQMALESIPLVLEKMPDAGLVVVGSGTLMTKLVKLSHDLKIDKNVVFVGWQTDLIPYYKGCDLFLNTSWYEGYGMVFKEAQAAGCKIVSTDVGIASEVGSDIARWDKNSIAEKVLAGF